MGIFSTKNSLGSEPGKIELLKPVIFFGRLANSVSLGESGITRDALEVIKKYKLRVAD